MKTTLKGTGMAFIAAIASIFFTGCKDDDGYSIGDFAVDLVTVNTLGNGTYSFTGDTWGTMWPAATSIWGYKPVNGERAFLRFNPLYDNFEGYDVAIKPEAIYPILTKEVETLTEENNDEYADHPAYITDVWIGGGYMNMIFVQRLPQNNPHRVSLVKDTTDDPIDDGYVHLEFRYNTYGDTLHTMPLVNGAASYNLESVDLENSKGIKLRINSAVNGERIIVFEKENTPAPASVAKTDFGSMKAK